VSDSPTFKEGETAHGSDGEQYTVIKVERADADNPHSRYTVKRASDGETVENFPGYLMMKSPAKKRPSKR
jgi:hypothetical protein